MSSHVRPHCRTVGTIMHRCDHVRPYEVHATRPCTCFFDTARYAVIGWSPSTSIPLYPPVGAAFVTGGGNGALSNM